MRRLTALLALTFLLSACDGLLLPGGAPPPLVKRSGSGAAAVSSAASSVEAGGLVTYGEIEDVRLKGFLALPKTPGKHPGVILIHEWWGPNENMADLARQFADRGYVALAVDLYEGKLATTMEEAQAYATAVRENTDRALDNLKQAVAYLKERADVDEEKLASVGWGFGGGWSYQMARNDLGVRASVLYYGQFDAQDDFADRKSSVLGHFGEDDAVIAVDSVKELQAILRTASGVHEVYVYQNVGNGFANDREGNEEYDQQAANLAWQRTLSFLTKAFSRRD